MEINIAHFYPELLNLYGDKGNIKALKKRAEWRGIKVNIKDIDIKENADFNNIDIALIGGGNDYASEIVLNRLKEFEKDIRDYVENDGILLALSSGFQILGKTVETDKGIVNGLGVLDIYTVINSKRFISNVVLKTDFGYVAGFENHNTKTYINDHKPFGEVVVGNGNNSEDGTEGVLYKNVLGSYLCGPLLPKNAKITDMLILQALRKKYGISEALEELDDSLENKALNYVLQRFMKD